MLERISADRGVVMTKLGILWPITLSSHAPSQVRMIYRVIVELG